MHVVAAADEEYRKSFAVHRCALEALAVVRALTLLSNVD